MRSVLTSVKKCDFLNHTFITHSKCDHMCDHTFIFAWEHKVVSIELANKMQEFNCELILGLVHFLQLDWPIKN